MLEGEEGLVVVVGYGYSLFRFLVGCLGWLGLIRCSRF